MMKSVGAASDCLDASLGLTLLLRDASAGGALSRDAGSGPVVFQDIRMSWKHPKAVPMSWKNDVSVLSS